MMQEEKSKSIYHKLIRAHAFVAQPSVLWSAVSSIDLNRSSMYPYCILIHSTLIMGARRRQVSKECETAEPHKP